MEKFIDQAISEVFKRRFDLETLDHVVYEFRDGVTVEVGEGVSTSDYEAVLERMDALSVAIERIAPKGTAAERAATLELLLEGLHQHKLLNKDVVQGQMTYWG